MNDVPPKPYAHKPDKDDVQTELLLRIAIALERIAKNLPGLAR